MMSIIVKELSKIYGSGENRVTALDLSLIHISCHFSHRPVGERR